MYAVEHQALIDACLIVGSQAELARRIGVTRNRLNNWINRSDRVSLEHVMAIEEATGGKITRYQLVPLIKKYTDTDKELVFPHIYERLTNLENIVQTLNQEIFQLKNKFKEVA